MRKEFLLFSKDPLVILEDINEKTYLTVNKNRDEFELSSEISNEEKSDLESMFDNPFNSSLIGIGEEEEIVKCVYKKDNVDIEVIGEDLIKLLDGLDKIFKVFWSKLDDSNRVRDSRKFTILEYKTLVRIISKELGIRVNTCTDPIFNKIFIKSKFIYELDPLTK